MQILFIQGGGADVHDAWDDKLVASLERELGAGWEVRYPRMPDEADPSYARWQPAILREIAAFSCEGRSPDSSSGTGPLPAQGCGLIIVGHSIGGAMMINALGQQSGYTPHLDGEGQGWGDRGRGAGLLNHPHPTSPIEGEAIRLSAIVLISAPFVGEGGWPGDEFETQRDLGARLPAGVPVHLFYGTEDETAPPAHARLYAKAIPQAELHLLPGRDHQLNNDLSEVAAVIRSV